VNDAWYSFLINQVTKSLSNKVMAIPLQLLAANVHKANAGTSLMYKTDSTLALKCWYTIYF